jgi:hypothetical protein
MFSPSGGAETKWKGGQGVDGHGEAPAELLERGDPQKTYLQF